MNKLLLVFIVIGVTACASYEHVRPGADGVHRVVVRATDRTEAEEGAIDEAKAFCKDRNLSAAFIQEDTKYTGSMNEGAHKVLKKASEVLSVIGNQKSVKPNGNGEDARTAGAVGSVLQDDEAYTADMKFKCI